MIRARDCAADIAEINRDYRPRRVRDERARQQKRGKADRALIIVIGKLRRTLQRRLRYRTAIPAPDRLLFRKAICMKILGMEVPERQAKLQHQGRERETAATSLHQAAEKLLVCPRQADHVPIKASI